MVLTILTRRSSSTNNAATAEYPNIATSLRDDFARSRRRAALTNVADLLLDIQGSVPQAHHNGVVGGFGDWGIRNTEPFYWWMTTANGAT